MDGEVFDLVVKSTGLPDESIGRELEKTLGQLGLDKEKLDLEQLRRVATRYLQDVFLNLENAKNKEC